MKFFLNIFLFTLSFQVLAGNHSQFGFSNNQLDFAINPVEEVYESGYLKLTKENQNSTKDLGLPELPVHSTLYMVDPNKDYDFNIIVNDSYTINDVEIYPYQGLDNSNKKGNLVVNNSFYSSNSNYPENNIIKSDRVRARNMELMPLSIVPYSYNLETKELEVFTNIEIVVTESESSDSRQPINTKRVNKLRFLQKLRRFCRITFS